MLTLMGLAAVAALVLAADDEKPKKAGARLEKATVAQVAKEFAADRAAAAKKFTPEKAAAGAAGGKALEISGEVAYTLPGGGGLQMTREGYTVTFKGPVKGSGKYATITVKGIATGGSIVVFEGEITRSNDPPKE